MAAGPPLIVPLAADTPLFTERVQLDGSDFFFRLDYSGREDRWYMSISDAASVPIVQGVKLVTNWPLLAAVSDSRRPTGELIAFDPLDGVPPLLGPPGLRDIGPTRRIQLLYFPLIVPVASTAIPAGGF